MEAIIGPQTEVEGSIRTNESIRVDGKIKGGIHAESILIGEKGVVLGDISANKITIGGKVKGNVAAASLLELLPSGQILGDIKTSKLVISDGACFEGNCQMIRPEGQVIQLNPDNHSHGNEKMKVVAGGKK